MFGLFGAKPVPDTSTYSHDGEVTNADGSVTLVPNPMVKIGGHDFIAGDAKSVQAFDSWLVKAKSSNEMIQVGEGNAHYPINSLPAKAEIVKAELQLKHGLDAQSAQKAVDSLPAFKALAPAKATFIFKGKPAPEASEPMTAKSPAIAGKAFRGPQGKVA